MMFASFHSNGTTPSYIDKLNNVASGILICSTIFNSNLDGRIPPIQGDLLSFISLIFLPTIFGGYNLGRRSVGDGGGTRLPTFQRGGQHRNCSPTFQLKKLRVM